MKARAALIVSSILLVPWACRVTGPLERITVTTDQLEYSLPAIGEVSVNSRIQNHSGSAAAFTGCPEPPAFVAEQLVDGRWRDAVQRGLICLGIYSPRTTDVAAGGSFEFGMSFTQPGHYRFRVEVGRRWGDPDATVFSNEFTVR